MSQVYQKPVTGVIVISNNRIVIKYDKDDIVFLGAVDTITGQYYSTDRFKDIWTLSTAEKMNAHNITEGIRTLQDDIGIIGDNELIDYIYEQFFNLIDNNILDIAKIVYDSYKYVYNLPENDFIGDQKDLTKNFYLSLKNNSKEEKALMIEIFKARLNFKYILNDIAQNAIQMTISEPALS